MRITAARRIVRSRSRAGARTGVLASVCFLLGIAASAVWFQRHSDHAPANPKLAAEPVPAIVLSDGTRSVLAHLPAPVEIRFYALLDPTSVSNSLIAFAGRVDRLLSEYEREAGGKIRVIRYLTNSDSNADAASADGIREFNRDKGAVCYLGLTVVVDPEKESLPKLDPEWEPALESDLSRVIARLAGTRLPPKAVVPGAPTTDSAAFEEVRRLIPDPARVSMEDGKKILTAAAFEAFKAATTESATRIKAAELRFAEAQTGGSEAEKQSARSELQQVRAEQTEKLKQIAARLQAQTGAFQNLKGTVP